MYQIPTNENGNIVWPDDLEQVIAEHSVDPEWTNVETDVAEWTEKVHFVVPDDTNPGGCQLLLMLDANDDLLWAYCMDHGMQPNARVRRFGPLMTMAIHEEVGDGKIPHPFVAAVMLHRHINALFAEQQASLPVPVEVNAD